MNSLRSPLPDRQNTPKGRSFPKATRAITVQASATRGTQGPPAGDDKLRTFPRDSRQSPLTAEGERFATYYVAFWSEGNVHVLCGHQHKALPDALACIQCEDGFVRAFTDGHERPLTHAEKEESVRALLALYLRVKELSRRDSKTGALNDRAFREVLGYESKRSRRNLKPLTVVSLDLDGFKSVNDTLGHDAGDLVLKIVVWTMQSTLREADSVARLGGDEFALLLPETNAESARVVLDKLRKALQDAMRAYGWEITFSIGAVTFRDPPATADHMIGVADKAMYQVKRTGKNRISFLALD